MLKQVPSGLLLLALIFCAGAKMAVADDLSAERDKMKMVLNVVSKEVAKNFYDADMKGLDWRALTDQAKQKIENAQSVTDMMRAIFILVDKLHDSHTRFLPPNRNISYRFGFNAKPIGNEIHVYEVQERGSAEEAGIKVGDRILAVNGFPADRSVYELMMWDFKLISNVSILEVHSNGQRNAGRTGCLPVEGGSHGAREACVAARCFRVGGETLRGCSLNSGRAAVPLLSTASLGPVPPYFLNQYTKIPYPTPAGSVVRAL